MAFSTDHVSFNNFGNTFTISFDSDYVEDQQLLESRHEYEELDISGVEVLMNKDGRITHIELKDVRNINPVADYEKLSDSLIIRFVDEQFYKLNHYNHQIMVGRDDQNRIIWLEIQNVSTIVKVT